MPPLRSADEQTDEQKAVRKRSLDRFEASEKLHKLYRDRWETFYALSRNYRRLQNQHAQSAANDADVRVDEMRREWGQELFIPYGFTVIETNVPRILATGPRMSVKPNDDKPQTYEACEPVKRLYERDQKKMEYEIKLQETVRSGLRYGLGVQKLHWERRYRSGRKVVSSQTEDAFMLRDEDKMLVFEGPMGESVDIFDFFWDSSAHDLGPGCEYLVHRTWRSNRYVADRVKEGQEQRDKGGEGGWIDLDPEMVQGLANSRRHGEVRAGRWEAAGVGNYQAESKDEHEVLEVWDRDRVVTILDRQIVVQDAMNPYLHGDYPFQIYRPTIVEHEFVGVGEIEPIAHLQAELNEMRGQRRDAATLALQRGYFYSQGMLNPKTVKTGAGVFVPVQGDPKEVIYPMPFVDLPASGTSEEEALKADIELTTAMSESVVGSSGEETATGTQLVQQAANKRIAQKAKNLFTSLLRPGAAQMHELYRQHYVNPNQAQTIRVEADQVRGQDPERTPEGYAFVQVGPRELNANIEPTPVDGSTEADNEAQKRTDAAQLVDALAPFMEELDLAKVAKYILQQFGVDEPDELLQPPEPNAPEVVEAIGRTMQEAGVPEELIAQVLEAAQQRLVEQPPEEEGDEEGSQNGASRKPEASPAGG